MALNKRKVLQVARKFAQKGAKAKALKEYNKLLKEDPRDAKLLLEVGDVYRRWGQNEEAIAQYGKVAHQYRQAGFDARAVAVIKQILLLDPRNYSGYVSLSELYQRMGLDSEAGAALQTAADGYHKEGRKTEALELLRQMAALDPTNTTSRLKVAELLRQEGMESEALAEYQAVVEELTNQQDRDQLVVVLQRILEVKPDQMDALTALFRNFMEAGALDQAEALALQAVKDSAEAPQFELLIEVYSQIGDQSKLVDATRGLAKVYRDRGDDEKARELMQRLPVDEVGSASRLAVDVSEVDAPVLDDGELIEDGEPFLTPRDASESAPAEAEDLELDLGGDPIDLGAIAEDEGEEEPKADEPRPLPEGDPDQLLAEASVYLRYGKREQAIASLRGVLAQDPDHRAALEKLGEAYAEGGQNSEAVEVWMQAAELIRAAGDAGALDVLKDRIGALDSARAEQIGPVEAAPSTSATPVSGADAGEAAGDAFDLDLDVDLDLDNAIDDVQSDGLEAGLDFGAESGDFEIELNDESFSFGSTSNADSSAKQTGPAAEPALPVEDTTPELDSSSEKEDDEAFEFVFDSDDSSVGDADSGVDNEDDDCFEFDADSADPTGPPTASTADPGATVSGSLSEEIEESEFYLAQEMYDEAEGVLKRILELDPNHSVALQRMEELKVARGGEPGEAPSPTQGAAAPAIDLEITTRLDDEDTLGAASESGEVAPFDHSEDEQDAFEIDFDVDDDDEVDAAAEPVESPAACEADEAPADEVMDAAETFDLREALADVLADDEEPATDKNAESGVLSTVEDGFESIFSEFKKGVSATLEAGDYDTRYDLGIAYREMELYEDAIGEFRMCLESPTRRFDSLYLMGLCARDLTRFDDAINHFEQALAMPDVPEERMAGVYFDLSVAEEGAGDLERACGSLRRVIELEADFPGAVDRLASLEAEEPSSPELAVPGEDFESFDDLFSDDDEDDADDEGGDDEVAAAAPTEAFESFDDLVSEAEAAIDKAEFVEDHVEETAPEVSPPVDEQNSVEPDAETKSPKKRGRKKISFV